MQVTEGVIFLVVASQEEKALQVASGFQKIQAEQNSTGALEEIP